MLAVFAVLCYNKTKSAYDQIVRGAKWKFLMKDCSGKSALFWKLIK
jgi:hypothetical protein